MTNPDVQTTEIGNLAVGGDVELEVNVRRMFGQFSDVWFGTPAGRYRQGCGHAYEPDVIDRFADLLKQAASVARGQR